MLSDKRKGTIMPHLKHIFYDITAGLLQSSPIIIALILIINMKVTDEIERLRKISIYILASILVVPFCIRKLLNNLNGNSFNVPIGISRITILIFIITLGVYIYNVLKIRKCNKENSK